VKEDLSKEDSMTKLDSLKLPLQSLVIFRSLLIDPVIRKAYALISSDSDDPNTKVALYASFVSELYANHSNFSEYLCKIVLENENTYVQHVATNKAVTSNLQECLENELLVLQELSTLSSDEVKSHIPFTGYLPSWETSSINLLTAYQERISQLHRYGYGQYASHYVFTIKDGHLLPVTNPDPVSLNDLKGYEKERNLVLNNTFALIENKPASNVLLYGDAGTGKSSTVKAITNQLHHKGLRLIEVPKKQLDAIPTLLETISQYPLKFILFIDDLSFSKNDANFGSLKAILEGSVTAKPSNVVIYATSNRRHLVKESFSDREGDDIHLSETIQELTSLSDRFGMLVSYFKPDKQQYLEIVHELAMYYNISLSGEKLEIEAERYAVTKNGRSPRVARQFIAHLQTKE